MPSLHNLFKNIFECARDAPLRIVGLHFAQVAVIANVIADTVLLKVAALLRFASELFHRRKSFPDRARILLAAADVVNLACARRLAKGKNKIRYIFGVNVVANLFPFITEDFVLAALDVATHKIAEEAVQLHAGVIGTGQAAAAQTAGGHAKIAAVFLHHHVRGHF